jgi:hypothetical protein
LGDVSFLAVLLIISTSAKSFKPCAGDDISLRRPHKLGYRYPEANTFDLAARELDGVDELECVPIADPPGVHAFRLGQTGHPPVHVVWDQRDAFDGESQPR